MSKRKGRTTDYTTDDSPPDPKKQKTILYYYTGIYNQNRSHHTYEQMCEIIEILIKHTDLVYVLANLSFNDQLNYIGGSVYN